MVWLSVPFPWVYRHILNWANWNVELSFDKPFPFFLGHGQIKVCFGYQGKNAPQLFVFKTGNLLFEKAFILLLTKKSLRNHDKLDVFQQTSIYQITRLARFGTPAFIFFLSNKKVAQIPFLPSNKNMGAVQPSHVTRLNKRDDFVRQVQTCSTNLIFPHHIQRHIHMTIKMSFKQMLGVLEGIPNVSLPLDDYSMYRRSRLI